MFSDIYDEPIWKDWLFYLTGLAILAGISSVSGSGNAFDLVFAVAIQFLLFGAIPGAIRNSIRRRRPN